MPGFDPLFERGRKFDRGTVEPKAAGTLRLPTGRIVVADPASAGVDTDPLVRTVPPGDYPVEVSVAWIEQNQEHRIAAARVRFSDRPVAKWEPALADGQDPDTLEPGQFFGYGVDAGTACFVDASLLPLDFDFFDQTIVPAMQKADERLLAGYAEVARGAASVVAFSSGAGDGMYASFWGLDDAGQPVVLVTEFRIVGTEVTRGGLLIEAAWPGRTQGPGDPLVLLEAGRQFEDGKVVRVDDAGTVEVTSGRLYVGAVRGGKPLALQIPNGRHRVRMSVVNIRFRKDMADVPGALVVELSDRPPVRWELAPLAGEDLARLGPTVAAGQWEVRESAALVIADAASRAKIAKAAAAIEAAVADSAPDEWKTATVKVDGKDVFAFAAGYLGGEFMFWGFSDDGSPAMLFTALRKVGEEVVHLYKIFEATKAAAQAAPRPKVPAKKKPKPAKKKPKPAKKKPKPAKKKPKPAKKK
jgi:hypothetical protein